MSKFYTVTVATKDGGYYDCLKHSCKKYNINLVTLGWNQKWQGFAWRWKIYGEFVNTLKDDDIVMWIDAYDILILKNKDTIINTFKKFNTGIVFGSEQSIIINMLFKNCNKAILNGGCHVGYVKYVKMLINLMTDNKLIEKWNNDDQNMLNDINCTNAFFETHTKTDPRSYIFYIAGTDERYRYDYLFNGNLADKNSCVIHGLAGLDMTNAATK